MVTVEAQMLIRKPVNEVFEAFINPEITTNFWFTKSNSKVEEGKHITWEWEMYQVSIDVFVKEVVENERISIEWDNPVTTVDFEFIPKTENTTYVVIRNYGFEQTGEELQHTLINNAGGFTTVLDGMKAYLEHNVRLNLIADKFPL